MGTVCEFPFLLSFTFCDSASVPFIYQGVTHNRLTVLRVETLSMCQSVCCWLSFPFGLVRTLLALGLLVLGSALVPNSVRKCSFLCLLFHMNEPLPKFKWSIPLMEYLRAVSLSFALSSDSWKFLASSSLQKQIAVRYENASMGQTQAAFVG